LFTTIAEKIDENKFKKDVGRETIQIKNEKGGKKKKSGCCGGSKEK
jgi:hypothetical protein